MVFQLVCDLHKLLKAFRQILLQPCDRLRCSDSGYNILSLCIDQVLAVNSLFTGGRISGKGNTGSGGIAHVSEYHGLYIDCSTPVSRNIVHSAVNNCSFIIPGTEYCLYSLHELLSRILWKCLSHLFFIDSLKAVDHLL